MKNITIVTPCFNEEGNVFKIYEQVKKVFEDLPQYTYEHVFIDNASTDETAKILRSISKDDRNVKLILNARNFGPIRSPFHGLLQASGDAVISIAADLQEPPALIKDFLEKWEEGYKIVAGVKSESNEFPLLFLFRKLCYRVMSKISDVKLMENFTGFGLYDKKIIEIFKKINEPYPYLRGLVSELGFKISKVSYKQPKRVHGSSKANIFLLYDWIMLALTSHSKLPIRLVTIVSFFFSILSFSLAALFFILKLIFWSSFNLGMAPLLIGLFFFSSIQLFFLGILGEYIISINTRVKNHPLVFEEERVNW